MSTDTAGNEQNPRAFGPPFDDSDADVIFRSSDQVDFYLYKNILAKSSPVFKDMFSIPQPSPGNGNTCPIVDLAENSLTISSLLAFCYPMPRPHLEGLEEIIAVLSAATKYDMKWVYDEMGLLFARSPLVAERPFMAFHIAYSHSLKREAHVAARALLRLDLDRADILADFEDVDLLSGSALRRLLIYHKECRSILPRQGLSETSWIKLTMEEGWGQAIAGQCPRYGCKHMGFHPRKYRVADGSEVSMRHWWVSYMDKTTSELRQRPWPPLVCTPEVMAVDTTICYLCCGFVAKAIHDFSQVYCAHLEKCIDRVEIDLPFL